MNSGTYIASNTAWPDTESILASIRKAQRELSDEPLLIKVWIGDDSMIEPTTEYPLIREDPYLDEDDCYIVAGMGVIAGKRASQRLWEQGYIAVWDDNPEARKANG